ncbi:MAG: hypothetical protein BWY09_02201 [Candidatus Hydrogenedentes bacterium ADurb.Bin179]|nr:MAG: hypothetical protein BWY09_02201 [Candidatus Hydrogenedentes bacterium ADurb.Bin179]
MEPRRIVLAYGIVSIVTQHHHRFLRQEGEVSKGGLFLRVQFKGPQRRSGFEMLLAAHQQLVFRVLLVFLFQALHPFLDDDKVYQLKFLFQGDDIPLRIDRLPGMHHVLVFKGTHHVHQGVGIFQQVQCGVIQRLVLVGALHGRDINEFYFSIGFLFRLEHIR